MEALDTFDEKVAKKPGSPAKVTAPPPILTLKITEKTPISWVRFAFPTSLAPQAPTTQALADMNAGLGKQAGFAGIIKLYFAKVNDVPHILVENEKWKMPARVPLTNVTSWG